MILKCVWEQIYVCGEETALLSPWKDSERTDTVPYPPLAVYGKPTIVNNVETL